MSIEEVLTTVVTSGTVASLLTFFLQTYIRTRLEQRYKLEIEYLKREHEGKMIALQHTLEIQKISEIEMIKRRQIAYPRLAELVYRLKRISDNILGGAAQGMLEELGSLTKEMEEILHTYFMDLERDQLFVAVHKFKNLAIDIGHMFHLATLQPEYSKSDCTVKARQQLIALCHKASDTHQSLIEGLTKAVSTTSDVQERTPILINAERYL